MTKPLQSKAYDYIKECILNDYFAYDTIYSETKIAKEISVSRTPMRDALHRLAQERYIDIIPSKGFCIHQMTQQDVVETYQIRSAIEGYCTLQITKDHQTPQAQALFTALEGLLSKQEAIFQSTQDIAEFVAYDNKFHTKIVAYMNNETFNALFGSYLFQIKRLAMLSLAHPGRMEETLREHAALLKTMQAGNVSDIYFVTMRHMETPEGMNLSDLHRTWQPSAAADAQLGRA